jgi:hypothetical protein
LSRRHQWVGRVDEKGVFVHVDVAARPRLRDALDRDGVVAASLFGSRAAWTRPARKSFGLPVELFHMMH